MDKGARLGRKNVERKTYNVLLESLFSSSSSQKAARTA
jgi:hypothetical protein